MQPGPPASQRVRPQWPKTWNAYEPPLIEELCTCKTRPRSGGFHGAAQQRGATQALDYDDPARYLRCRALVRAALRAAAERPAAPFVRIALRAAAERAAAERCAAARRAWRESAPRDTVRCGSRLSTRDTARATRGRWWVLRLCWPAA